MKKYKLSDETKTTPWGTVLHRVVATTTFTLACGLTINAGDVGGWIEKASNLSDNAWVADNAWVYDNARVSGDAWVYGSVKVSGYAKIYGDAQVSGKVKVFGDTQVFGYAKIYDSARVYGNAQVSGNAIISDNAAVYGDAQVYGDTQISGDAKVMNVSDYAVFKSDWSSGRYFTWTKSNDMWTVGDFYCTGDELIKEAYADSEDSGKHYEACVKSVKTL